MKFAVVVLILVLALAQSGSTTTQYAQKLCRTEDDCDWDQCCIDAETRLPGFNGICSNPTRRGHVCNPDLNDRTPEGRFRTACPCEEGLNCQPKEEVIQGRNRNIYICQV